jgi:hypothetical protein
MSSADAVERARNAARSRWVEQEGDPVLTRAVDTVASRRADLTSEQLAELAAVLGQEDDGD